MTGDLQRRRTGSLEKVRAAIDRAEGFADDPTAPLFVRMASGSISMMRAQLEAQLPDNDQDLDELLDKGARWMDSLKSDA